MLPKKFVNGFKNFIFINLFDNINKYIWKYLIKNREMVSIFLSTNQFVKCLKNKSKFYEMDT